MTPSLARSQSGSGVETGPYRADRHLGAPGESGLCPGFCGWSRARARIGAQHPHVGQDAFPEAAVGTLPGITAARSQAVAGRRHLTRGFAYIVLAAPQEACGSPNFTEGETDALMC